MNCNRCQFKFDQFKHVPKLLIMCGHSLCQKCCCQLFRSGKIECIQCRTNTITDKVSSLPKNLALISERTTSPVKQCQKHQKKYQAFCSNQKALICIQCILQDGHKNHQINSIAKSFQKQLSLFNKKVDKAQNYLKAIRQKAEQNVQLQTELMRSFQSVNQVVRQSFLTIKKLINQQQQAITEQIKNSFKVNNQKFIQQSQTYNNRISQTQGTLLATKGSLDLSEIQFLDQINERQQTLSQIKFSSFQNPKLTAFTHTKSSILEGCMRVLTNQKSDSKVNCISSYSSQTSNISTKSQRSVFGEPLQGFRKAAFSNISNCQNNRPQKRVSSRKQPISHQVQAPNLRDKALKPINNVKPMVSKSSSVQKKIIKKINIVETENQQSGVEPLNTQFSAVNFKESFCNSFMSNMTNFMSEKRSIFILGGFNQENNNIIKLDLNSMTYQEVTKLNFNRSKFGAIFADQKIYVFGGKRGKERLNDVQVFDIQNQAWIKAGNMNKIRSGFGAVYLQNQIYLIGGNDGQSILNTVQSFNIKTSEWTRLPSMIQGRDQLAVIVGNDNKIYAIGGFGGPNNQPLKTVECFDTKTKQWRQIPKMKYARRALSAAVLADGIYSIGGFDGQSYMSSVQKYDQLKNQWMQIPSMNIARCTHSSIAIYETQQIFVFGGFDFLPLNKVQKYSLINNRWQQIMQMPSPRFMHSTVLVKEFLF